MQNYAWGTSTASYTGTIVTGINEGVTWLRAYCSDTNYNSTVNVDVHFLESGPYLFKNRESNKYMSVEGHSTAAGAQIIQESYKGELWQEFYLQRDFTTGYIRIKNRNSSQYLGVENNSSAHDADIKQYAYSASSIGQQFKIERISGGDTIKIIPRTGEGQTPQRVVCVANYIDNTDGVHIKQRDFGANDGYYRDEWYVYKFDRSSEFGELVNNMQKLYELAQTYSVLQLLADPTSTELNPVELTMQYIRRGVYNSNYPGGIQWLLATGSVNQQFVAYVANHKQALHDYFNHTSEWIIEADNGDKIDMTHLAAVYNSLLYDSIAPFSFEQDVDDLSGWGGDLRSSVPYIMKNVSYSNDYQTIYRAAYDYIGHEGNFNMPDLLSDVDACNLYNMQGSNNPAEKFLDYYYGGMDSKRFTYFVGDLSYAEIYSRSESMITMTALDWVWPIKKIDENGNDTDEDLILTDTQIEAICDAYTTYIIDKTGD